MDSFEIKLKIRGLFIKLWKLPISLWKALDEGKMLLLCVAIPGFVTHSRAGLEISSREILVAEESQLLWEMAAG